MASEFPPGPHVIRIRLSTEGEIFTEQEIEQIKKVGKRHFSVGPPGLGGSRYSDAIFITYTYPLSELETRRAQFEEDLGDLSLRIVIEQYGEDD